MNRFTRKHTERFANHIVDLVNDIESWKRDHDEAMHGHDLEEVLTIFQCLAEGMMKLVGEKETESAELPTMNVSEARDWELVNQAVWNMTRAVDHFLASVHKFENSRYPLRGTEELASANSKLKALHDESERRLRECLDHPADSVSFDEYGTDEEESAAMERARQMMPKGERLERLLLKSQARRPWDRSDAFVD